MAYDYITSTGTIVPDTSTTLEEVQQEYLDALGQDLDLSPSTPQGQLITVETAARTGVINNNALLANQLNPNQSTGVFLRSIGALMGISDTPTSRSIAVDCVLHGTIGVQIPAGTRAINPQGAVFLSINPVALVDDGTGTGAATVSFQASAPGPIAAPAGSLEPADPISGWASMTQPFDAVLGSVSMTDYQFMLYRQNALANQSQNSTNAAKSKVSMLPGVTSVAVRDNDEDTTQTVDGVVMPPNSMWVCVNDDGGVSSDIAMTLLGCKAPGCKWTPGATPGSFGTVVTQTEVDPVTGQSYTVTFVRSVPVPAFVQITVSNGTSSADLQTAVVDAILAYATGQMPNNAGLIMGQDVSPFELSGAVVQQIPGCYVSNCQVSLDGTTWTTTPLAIALWQRATIAEGNITVNVVN